MTQPIEILWKRLIKIDLKESYINTRTKITFKCIVLPFAFRAPKYYVKPPAEPKTV